MIKLSERTSIISRVAVVLLVMFSVTWAGIDSAERQSQTDQVTPSVQETEIALLECGPPLPEDAPENMAPDGKPNTEQSAVLTTPLILQNNNPNDHTRTENRVAVNISELNSRKFDSKRPVSSLCLVSTSLGDQATLVGARPSGTS